MPIRNAAPMSICASFYGPIEIIIDGANIEYSRQVQEFNDDTMASGENEINSNDPSIEQPIKFSFYKIRFVFFIDSKWIWDDVLRATIVISHK